MSETLNLTSEEQAVANQAEEMYAKHKELSKEEDRAREAALPKLGEEGLEERRWPEQREPALKARREAIEATYEQLGESRAHFEANKQAYVEAAKKEAEAAGHVISENPDIASRAEREPTVTDTDLTAKRIDEREKARQANLKAGKAGL